MCRVHEKLRYTQCDSDRKLYPEAYTLPDHRHVAMLIMAMLYSGEHREVTDLTSISRKLHPDKQLLNCTLYAKQLHYLPGLIKLVF